MVIYHRHIETAVEHLSDVHILVLLETYCRWSRLTHKEDAVTIVAEEVSLDSEVVEETELDTDVALCRLFPLYLRVTHFSSCDTAYSGITCCR